MRKLISVLATGRLYIALLIVFSVGNACAADYSWVIVASKTYRAASPQAVFAAYHQGNWPGWVYEITSTEVLSPTAVKYTFRNRPSASGGWTNSGLTVTPRREGDSCPAGATYNPTKMMCEFPDPNAGNTCSGQDEKGFKNIINSSGECVSILRADKPAVCKSLGNSAGAVHSFVSYGEGNSPDSSTVTSNNGCKVSNVSLANCKTPVTRSSGGISIIPGGTYCDVVFIYTGEVADPTAPLTPADPSTNTDGVCSDSMSCTPQDQPEVNEKRDCQYVEDAEGRKICTSSSFSGSPGTQQCATGENGRVVCVTKHPSSTGSKVDTKVETKPNPDGSTTSTKTDVATKVDCPAGPSSCKSTTTTTTTTTQKDADGNVTGTTSQTTCSGDKCTSGGSTGGGGAGNGGKGDATTNCDPSTDPKACEGTSTDGGGKKCDAPIQCDGDAVMCAILQQQHKDTCELMKDPTEEEKAKFDQQKTAEFGKVDALQSELDQKASGLFSNFQATASGTQYGGRCLTDKQVDIMGHSFTFPFSQACPYLYLLRYALVAMAYLTAARIVSRGI